MREGEELRIHIFHSPQSLIRIHPAQAKYMSLANDRPSCLCSCGQLNLWAPVLLDPNVPVNQVYISSHLSERVLQGIQPSWIAARLLPERISVGPTIGILCNPVWNMKRGTLRPSKQLPVLEKLTDVGRRQGVLVYVFRIQDVDFTRAKVRGYVHVDGTWKPALLPMPDAIYDQVISRRVERSKEYLQQRLRLSEMYGSRIFNDGFFDKWQVHEWLTKDKKAKNHIPAAVRYSDSRQAATFVRGHQVTFLKPIHGSLGLGIIKVTREPDGGCRYDLKRKDGKTQGRFASAEAVMEALRKRLMARPYIVQEGISLARYMDRPFDIRIVLQRDESGEWKRTKMFARVAGEGDFTSNISSGGEALPVDTVFEQIFTNVAKRRQCRQTIRKVSMLATEVIEQQSGKKFGELGIDLAVDEQGHVWIIEVNSKPWKSPTTTKGRQDLVDLSFTRPIQYAIRLAQQK